MEAPQWGDPIHTLQQAFDTFEAGAIFIRHPGRTDRAGPADIAMLTQRVARPQPLDIVISAEEELLCGLDTSPGQVEAWLEAERKRLLFPLESEKMERIRDEQAQRLSGLSTTRFDFANIAAQVAAASQVADALSKQLYGRVIPEDRTEEGYLQEIESYLDEACPHVAKVAIRAFTDDRCSHLSLIVDNPTERNIPDVQIQLTFERDVTPYSIGGTRSSCWPLPGLWGPRQEGGVSALMAGLGDRAVYSLPGISRGPLTSVIESEVSGQTVTYWIGHLRPHGTFRASPVALLRFPRKAGRSVAAWTATSKRLDGVLGGEFRVAAGDVDRLGTICPPES